jgi:hypothetical protein
MPLDSLDTRYRTCALSFSVCVCVCVCVSVSLSVIIIPLALALSLERAPPRVRTGRRGREVSCSPSLCEKKKSGRVCVNVYFKAS